MRIHREALYIDDTIGQLLAGDLDTIARSVPPGLYWPYVATRFQELGVDGLYYAAAEQIDWEHSAKSPVPGAVLHYLRVRTRQRAIRTTLWLDSFGRLLARLNDASVIPLLLRGADAVLRCYRDSASRPLERIDMRVPAFKVARTDDVLRHFGYECQAGDDRPLAAETVTLEAENAMAAPHGWRYRHAGENMPPIHVHRRVVEEPPAFADGTCAGEDGLLTGLESRRLGEGVYQLLAPECALAHYADTALQRAFAEPVAYADAAALAGSRPLYYARPGKPLDWSKVAAVAAACQATTPVYFLVDVLGDYHDMRAARGIGWSVSTLDRLALRELKRSRFENAEHFLIELRRARGLQNKARTLLRRVLSAARAG